MHKGAGYDFYKGSPYQRGYGLGGAFRRFFSWIVPIFKQHALPTIKDGLKELGKTTLLTTADFAKDVAYGKDIKSSFQERVSSGIDEIKDHVEKKLRGSGKRKKKGIKRSSKLKNFLILKKKKQLDDIFQ